MKGIKVVLADDHTIVRKGLRSLLDAEVDMDVIGEAGDGKEAIELVGQLKPHIVVMDIGMPVLNGLEATRRIIKKHPDTKVLILTMHTNEEYVFEILQAGASGYIIKKAAPTELVAAIRAVKQGESFLSPSISKKVIEEYLQRAGEEKREDAFDLLTDREREVLQLIAEGLSTREIAEKLFISTKTVETHRMHMMEKLDLHGTADLTRYAIRKGIVDSER
ncbi:MAG: response regulator transcription factor [Candidatus Aminicenantaceae bacterium]